MEKLTVSEWLRNIGLDKDDIYFIESVLTFASTIQKMPDLKSEELNRKVKALYPDYKIDLTKSFNYHTFARVLEDNNIKVNLDKLLTEYKSQGICKDYCNTLLKQKNH